MESGEYEEGMVVEFSVNGNSMKATDVEAKLDEGNIQEAESSLREGLSLNFEVILHIICSFWYEKKNPSWPQTFEPDRLTYLLRQWQIVSLPFKHW